MDKTPSGSEKSSVAVIERLPRSGVIRMDRNICLTCRQCEVACSLYHEGECNPALSRIHVVYDDFVPEFPDIEVCKQCDWPACYYACASLYQDSAISIDPETGARAIDEAKCAGCGSCPTACPLMPEHPVLSFRQVSRKRVYFRCDLCADWPPRTLLRRSLPIGSTEIYSRIGKAEKVKW